jgi:hypothetical protein
VLHVTPRLDSGEGVSHQCGKAWASSPVYQILNVHRVTWSQRNLDGEGAPCSVGRRVMAPGFHWAPGVWWDLATFESWIPESQTWHNISVPHLHLNLGKVASWPPVLLPAVMPCSCSLTTGQCGWGGVPPRGPNSSMPSPSIGPHLKEQEVGPHHSYQHGITCPTIQNLQ